MHHGVQGFQLELAVQLEARRILAAVGSPDRRVHPGRFPTVGPGGYGRANLPLSEQGTAGYSGCKLELLCFCNVHQIHVYVSLFQRFDRLLRPSMGSQDGTSNIGNSSRLQYTRRPAPPLPVRTINSGSTMISLESRPPQDDAPPKYTPPPSYTTATGARIAKMLRNSIRRSVRR